MDRWRRRVCHRDDLRARASVAAVILRRPSPRNHVIARTVAGRIGVGEGEMDGAAILRSGGSRLAQHEVHVRVGRISALNTRRSEEHTSELQSRFGISYAVFCL